jgi:hypothetical protein
MECDNPEKIIFMNVQPFQNTNQPSQDKGGKYEKEIAFTARDQGN